SRRPRQRPGGAAAGLQRDLFRSLPDRPRWQQCRGGLHLRIPRLPGIVTCCKENAKMASIHREIPIEAHPEEVWAAVRDFGAVHKRLAPGFVVDAHLDGDARIVTFANGTVARELL